MNMQIQKRSERKFQWSTLSLPSKQRGVSPIGWLLILLVCGFFVLLAFKVSPPYFDNMFVIDSLKSIPELRSPDYGYDTVSKNDIQKHIQQHFTINNVRNVERSDIEVTKKARQLIVDINYEIRIPMFYNIDVVVHFENQFDSERPEECCKPKSGE